MKVLIWLFFLADEDGNPGVKDVCVTFDQMIISCMSGICKNVSEVYDCNYKSKLDDLYDENQERG